MSGAPRLVRMTPAHHPEVLALNADHVDVLSPMDQTRLDWILQRCAVPLVAEDDEGVLGFCLALASGTDYDGRYYAWFSERYPAFLYLDRIAVGDRARRRGVGSLLYDACEEQARPSGRMLCEVNLRPRNDASLAFHAARGYVEVAQLPADDTGEKVVSMLAKELDGGGTPAG